jgi:hypothetical protein
MANTANLVGARGPTKSGFEPACGVSSTRHFAYRQAVIRLSIDSGLATSLGHRWRLRVISMVHAVRAVDDV